MYINMECMYGMPYGLLHGKKQQPPSTSRSY
jgi:hypothetical protein